MDSSKHMRRKICLIFFSITTLILFQLPVKAFNPCDDNSLEGSTRCLKLAKQGKTVAQASMARKYTSGLGGIKANIDLGYMWGYIVVLKKPDDFAIRVLLDGLEKNYMNSKKISEIRRLAKICIRSEFKNCPE